MCHYTHFTKEEREKSRVLKAQGLSIRAIAKELGRTPSSVSREFRRNCYVNGNYAAHYAEKRYRKRRKNCARKVKLLDDAICDYVMEKMNLRWSPEQIAGRVKRDKEPFCISFPTIYRAIDSGILPPQLKKIMRFKWKHKKCKGTDNRGKIPDTTPIHDRPAGAENRSRYEHWDLDMRKTSCFGTHVEHKSGYLVAFRIDDRQDNAFNCATIKAFSSIPEKLKKSFTVDNGKAFAAYKVLAEATGMKVFFCDPYSPWKCCTNEITSGLLRHFLRKGLHSLMFLMMIIYSVLSISSTIVPTNVLIF